MSRPLARAVSVQRAAVGLVMALATAVSWTYLVSVSRAPHDGARPLTAGVAMWIAMMLGMMLPAAAPMCATYVRVATRDGERHALPIATFVGAYLTLWIGVSALAGWTQAVAASSTRLTALPPTVRTAAPGFVLMAAGIYQFTPLKHACLRRCRTPLGFLVTEWRPGTSGALRLGLLHGKDCIVCCWSMVTLMFIVGVMSLLWMAALTFLMLLEKCLPGGHVVARASGAALVLWGVLQLI